MPLQKAIQREPLDQFEKLISLENLNLAFKRLMTVPRNLYKDLYTNDYKIFGFELEANLKTLSNILKDEFEPKSSMKYYIPKKNNLARPITLLNFIDLITYQSIVNIIADVVYDDISIYQNTILFGSNYCRSFEKEAFFFYKKHKEQWKNYNQQGLDFLSQGYKFRVKFDIASYYDSIDHNILKNILLEKFKIEEKVVNYLISGLEKWSQDSSREISYPTTQGIPQGPISSKFLGDLYLLEIDKKMDKLKLDSKYIRYVDDIRIYAKDERIAQKSLVLLDLYCKDLSLISQVSKTGIEKINSSEEIINDKLNFSAVALEYKKNNDQLKNKTHNTIRKIFIDYFTQKKNHPFAKTIINFSLYRLNKDERIKKIFIHALK